MNLTSTRKTYMGEVCRDGNLWHIWIPELRAATFTKWPEQNDMAARMLVSISQGVPLDDVRVMLEVVDR